MSAAEIPAPAKTTAGLINELADRLRPVFQKHHVLKAIVFGSIARNDVTRHGDLDLILVMNTAKRFLDRYDPILREVGTAAPGRDIDLLIYTPSELDAMADRPFIAAALREGKSIYESGEKPPSGRALAANG